MDVNKHCYLNKINWRLGRIFSHTELLTYEILYPMMLNMQKIQFSFINCMIRIIENGVAADLRKTEATSDQQQTTHEEIKIFQHSYQEDGELLLKYKLIFCMRENNFTLHFSTIHIISDMKKDLKQSHPRFYRSESRLFLEPLCRFLDIPVESIFIKLH